jgi:thiamine pyrophosphate-dependent acetolactate synthase large subunit-like protein
MIAREDGGEKGFSDKAETGGELFLRALQEKDVEFVFGTTGAGMADIQDAMVVVKPPKWIQGLHEFVTVNAASGYALASENYGVALIDRNVGTANAVGAFYCSYLNSAPVVVFASVNLPGVPIPTGEIEYHYVSNEANLIGPWIKWNARVESLATLKDDVTKGIYLAKTEQQGPVYITLRQDLMARELSVTKAATPSKEKHKENPTPSFRLPDDSTIERIYGELLSHEMPEIIVSHLGRHRDSLGSLVKFAHTFGIPVNDFRTFMNFPTTDPLHVGFTQPTKPPKFLPSVDLIIALETGILPSNKFPNKSDAIDLTSDPLHRQDVVGGGDYGSTLFPASVRSVCDVGPTLEKVCKLAENRMDSKEKESISDRISKMASLHRDFFEKAKKQAQKSYDSGKLDAFSIGKILNENWSSNCIWVDGAISPRENLLSLIDMKEPGSYFSNPSLHLGAAVGMAYGVALSNRHYVDVKGQDDKLMVGRISHADIPKPVICTTGDGDAIFGNIPSALWTCSHYGIGVAYLILNNACWGIEWPPIENSTKHWAKNADDFEFLDLDKPRISFENIARGFNVETNTVKTPEEFEQSILRALQNASNDTPMLIDIIMEKFTGEKESRVV